MSLTDIISRFLEDDTEVEGESSSLYKMKTGDPDEPEGERPNTESQWFLIEI